MARPFGRTKRPTGATGSLTHHQGERKRTVTPARSKESNSKEVEVKTLLAISLALGALTASVSAAMAAEATGKRCPVNWGTAQTELYTDNGCVYQGDPRLGGVPIGWYANTEWGNVGPGQVFTASAITLRPLDRNVRIVPFNERFVSTPLTFVTPPAASASPSSVAGSRCNINFGDAATFATADNGCTYEGVERLGGIPSDWYADTPIGRVEGPVALRLSVLTLRLKDTNRTVPLLFAAPTAPAPTAAAGIRCNVNFGDAVTFTTGDNGCKYEGPERSGGIPAGWYADTPFGKVSGNSVIRVSVLTLRPEDGRPVPLL